VDEHSDYLDSLHLLDSDSEDVKEGSDQSMKSGSAEEAEERIDSNEIFGE
jgi:hypothetical protein